MTEQKNWFYFDEAEKVESPGLVFYADRIAYNISLLIKMIDRIDRLRPHAKTHKSPELTRLLLAAGITKYKCATIPEAEMLGICAAPDVLLAYQPTGPNVSRFVELLTQFPATRFSCLVDDKHMAEILSAHAIENALSIDVFIDVNVGMDRTGILPEKVLDLYEHLQSLKGLKFKGLHAYDGHIHDHDLELRKVRIKPIIQNLNELSVQIAKHDGYRCIIVAGGTPSFPVFAAETEFECSPGTFALWDKGYQDAYIEQEFKTAALMISRVVSLPAKDLICTDLGHKAVAAENILAKRVHFLNAPDLVPKSQSEEHLVLKTPENHHYKVGDILYGLPFHICPTVALHDRAYVTSEIDKSQVWKITSRTRKITI